MGAQTHTFNVEVVLHFNIVNFLLARFENVVWIYFEKGCEKYKITQCFCLLCNSLHTHTFN